ncbi:hypothetical protein [Haloechinothrix salitolerans]|uniref:Uncharacterized protein n=1 Tax=Haloechinothrix salitolerans TaxID=926830 RepID=A0ABW2BT68_9PSEU
MSTFDVLEHHGAWRLAAFLGCVAVFLLLHLARWPFRLIERALLAVQRGLDARITTALTPPAARPFHTTATA